MRNRGGFNWRAIQIILVITALAGISITQCRDRAECTASGGLYVDKSRYSARVYTSDSSCWQGVKGLTYDECKAREGFWGDPKEDFTSRYNNPNETCYFPK